MDQIPLRHLGPALPQAAVLLPVVPVEVSHLGFAAHAGVLQQEGVGDGVARHGHPGELPVAGLEGIGFEAVRPALQRGSSLTPGSRLSAISESSLAASCP